MSSSSSARRKRPWPFVLVLLTVVILGGLGYLGWRWFGPKPGDPVRAMEANNRGVWNMEQFNNTNFVAAISDFEEAIRLEPDWLPAQINLGIALLNTADEEQLNRAVAVFQQVLTKDPNNPHAHYCLGMIALYRNQLPEAYAQFEAVLKIDPKDAHTWMHLGLTHPNDRDSPEAKACFEEALKLNPYLNTARYQLAQNLMRLEPEKAMELLKEKTALFDATWEEPYQIRYSEMGPYASVIGRRRDVEPTTVGPLPLFANFDGFAIAFPEGTTWAKKEDVGAGIEADLRRAVRERFGATMVLFDYDNDKLPDLFLIGAVVQGGKVRDLLLHNDGKGKFSDVTTAAGLAELRFSLGCAVADFDNDGSPDLFLSGVGRSFLFRNTGEGKFTDVSAQAGVDKVDGVGLGAGWLDLDQDSDLDLLIARYAATPEKALARLKGDGEGAGLVVFLNVGEAQPAQGDKKHGLTVSFRKAEGPETLLPWGAVTGFAASDRDADRDVDLIVLADGMAPTVVVNDRLLRFHNDTLSLAKIPRWNGALVLNVNHDEESDVLLVPAGEPPVLWHGKEGKSLIAPPLAQAQALDLDLDSWTDIIGLSADRKAVLLHNEAGKLIVRSDTFGVGADVPSDLIAIAVADLDDDCAPDVLLWSEKEGLKPRRNLGNHHRAIRLKLTGRRDKGEDNRTNADGIGAWAVAQAGPLWTAVENTTLNAGLGQSRLPLTLGIGRANQADVVRVRWPDSVPQAELNVPTCELFRLVEKNRKGTSCPVLMTWDGQRFRFVTDFLGAGAMGEGGADGSVRPPRPEESVKIEPGQLVPRDGHYLIKIAEPMDEVLYLDHLRLDVVDHPAGVAVYPDERFVTAGPQPSQELLAFRDRIKPMKVVDHRRRDVTERLRERDRLFVDEFARRAWLGYAEEHFIDVDFGDALARFGPKDRLYLVLAGWTDYPYPESIFAATQAGVALLPPVLERRDGDQWRAVGDLGFPAGLPRVMTRDVTGLLNGPTCSFRIRTNMQIYWDELFIAPVAERDAGRVTPLPPARASLAHRGFMQEVLPEGRPPLVYDDDRTEPVAVTPWKGMLTRTGDVTPLLTATDDRFVLCGPGDEITVRFDARSLPPLAEGWQRSFVLRTWGYCKDTAPCTLTGGSVEPLPFRGMTTYPYGSNERSQAEAAHGDYPRLWNTRPAGGK